MTSTRILLVEDHMMFRSGMKALLETETGFEVVGEAVTGDDGVDQVRELKPDVVVMDLSMPGSNGLDATRRIAALGLNARVLVLTVHAEKSISFRSSRPERAATSRRPARTSISWTRSASWRAARSTFPPRRLGCCSSSTPRTP